MIHTQSGWKKTQLGAPLDLHGSFNFANKSAPTKNQRKGPILFIGGVHGDEPEGVAIANGLLQELSEGKIQAHRDWLLIPILNPDGYASNERTNGRGVDLNRNFPCRNWSAEHTKARYYPGPSPGSELETAAIVELVERTKPSLIIHFHSWKPMIVCTSNEIVPEARVLAEGTGYKLKNSIGYPTPGSLGDWAWLEHGIPVICTEEKEKAKPEASWKKFGPPLAAILSAVE